MDKTSKEMQEFWQNLEKNEKAHYLINSGHLADCTFVVGSNADDLKTFACHKWILTFASPVFERMFHGDFKESNSSKEIRLTDVSPSIFQKFRNFLYYNDTEKLKTFSVESLTGLSYLGKKYIISSLTTACIDAFKSKLNCLDVSDLVRVFEFALLFDSKALIEDVVKLLNTKVEQLKSCACIFDLDFCTFYELMKILKPSEITRFNMIQTYVKMNAAEEEKPPSVLLSTVTKEATSDGTVQYNSHEESGSNKSAAVEPEKVVSETNVSNKNSYSNNETINMMIELIDFNKMTAKEFCAGPGKSDFLDLSQKYEILSELMMKLCSYCGRAN